MSKPASTFTGQEVKKFAVMQKTSQMLYDALSVACTKHTEHTTRFSLRPILNSNTSQIRFNLAIRPPPSKAISFSQDLVWLTVESSFVSSSTILNPPEGGEQSTNKLQLSLKRKQAMCPTSSSCVTRGKLKKAVRFRSPSPPCQSIAPPASASLFNICQNNNFCNHLQNVICESVNGNHCIGYLEQTADVKYLIYIDSNASLRSGGPTKSLLELLRSSKKAVNLAGQFSQYERTCLATALATAVLQFHPTPWLPNSLSSSNVYFDCDNGSTLTKADGLKEPFVDVSVKAPDPLSSQDSDCHFRHFAPNPFLFRLGVILLELAFEAPLKNMQKPVDWEGGLEESYAEFFTAKRMARAVSSAMGTRYAEVVRKCLQCNFGRGDDLSSPELQEAFYGDVVCELGRLEQAFRRLHVAA